MIQVSNAIKNILEADARDIDMRILNASDNSVVNCSIKNISLHKGACGKFDVGTIYVPYAEIECDFAPTMPDEIILQFGVNVNNTRTYTSIGKFVITSNDKSVYSTAFIAQGMISKTANDVLFTSEPSNKTLQDIMTAIVSKGYSVSYKNGLSIPSYEITELISGISVRDALQIVATCVGAFVTEDASGGIVMSKFNSCTTSDLNLSGARSSSIPNFRGVYEVLGCKVVVDSGTTYEEATYNLEKENPYFTSDMWDFYKANLDGLTFSVGDFNVSLGDPRLEAWDCVKIIDDNLIEHYMPCLTLTFDYSGGLTMNIEADAELDEEKEVYVGGVLSKTLAEVKAQNDENRAEIISIGADLEQVQNYTGNLQNHVLVNNDGITITAENWDVYSIQDANSYKFIDKSSDTTLLELNAQHGATMNNAYVKKQFRINDWMTIETEDGNLNDMWIGG